jgi:hypothetical protein
MILVDVILALYVVVIALLPITALLISARYLDRQAQLNAVATNAAELEIEALRAQSFANTKAETTGTFIIPPALLTTFPNVSMSGSFMVTSVSGLGDSGHGVLQVAVLVTWNRPDLHSKVSSVRLDSYIAQGLL